MDQTVVHHLMETLQEELEGLQVLEQTVRLGHGDQAEAEVVANFRAEETHLVLQVVTEKLYIDF
jgi:hypothetical protein